MVWYGMVTQRKFTTGYSDADAEEKRKKVTIFFKMQPEEIMNVFTHFFNFFYIPSYEITMASKAIQVTSDIYPRSYFDTIDKHSK